MDGSRGVCVGRVGGVMGQNVVLVSYEMLRSLHGKFLRLRPVEAAEEVQEAVEVGEEGQCGVGSQEGLVDGEGHPALVNSSAGIERKKQKSLEAQRQTLEALFTGKWWRVVLDEAHVIKNRRSLNYKACLALNATYRWCETHAYTHTHTHKHTHEHTHMHAHTHTQTHTQTHTHKHTHTHTRTHSRTLSLSLTHSQIGRASCRERV